MRPWQVCLMFVLTFFWIWSVPLLVIGVLCAVPFAMAALPICLAITLFSQYVSHGAIIANHPVRRWISNIPWCDWFPCNQLKFEEQCIITVHPHGLLCCGAIAGVHLVPESETVLCVAPVLFYVPVIGWLLKLLACIPANKNAMQSALAAGHSLLVVPGGVPEIVLAETGDDEQRFARYGVLKLNPSVPVHVVFVRGECSTYKMIQMPFLQLRVWLSWRLNIPLVTPIMLGHYGTWLPKRQPLFLETRPLSRTNKNATDTSLRSEYDRVFSMFVEKKDI
mgnify:CR=1 FL=1